jgi:hypothetical protein
LRRTAVLLACVATMKIVQPNRATRTYTQHLIAGPAAVFPLLCPVREVADGSEADITYSHTSLGPEGDAFVESFTDDHYRKFMLDWESRVNYYLGHACALGAAS